jgi:hypothetical protein
MLFVMRPSAPTFLSHRLGQPERRTHKGGKHKRELTAGMRSKQRESKGVFCTLCDISLGRRAQESFALETLALRHLDPHSAQQRARARLAPCRLPMNSLL